MEYYIDLSGNMNARREPNANDNSNIIRVIQKGTRVEGDELVKDASGRDWLKVLMIGGVATTEPTFVATYTTSGVLKTNPLPPTDPGFAVQVELTFVSESPVSITLNGVPVGQGQYSGTIVIAPVG